MLKVKTCFDCKLFDVAIWVACLNREDGPRVSPSYETLSMASQGALKMSSVVGHPLFLVRDHFSSPRVVANLVKMMKGTDLHPKDHNIQIFTDASYEGWVTHLDQVSAKGLWSNREKKATHKCSGVEGGISGPDKGSRTSVKIKQCWLLQTTQQW